MKRAMAFMVAVGLLLSLAGGLAAGEKIVLKVGHSQNDKGDWHKSLEVFRDELAKRTGGAVEVQIFASEALGPEMDNITSIHQGIAEMVVSGDSMVNWAPYAAALALPYAVGGYDAMIKIVEDPAIGGVIEKNIIDNVKLRPVGYFIRTPRNLTSNKRVEKMEDLKGLKLRIPNNPIHQKMWNAFGASANPMNFSEVFSSLQNGTIDAQENPYAQIIAANLNEVQKYLVKTEHMYAWIYVLIGEDLWQTLPKDVQAAIVESGKAMSAFQHDYIRKQAGEQEAYLKKSMEFIDIDKAPFIEKAKIVMKDALSPEVYGLYQKMLVVK